MGNTPDAHETHAWVLHPDIKTDYSARAATDALAEAVSLAHALPGLEVMGETIVRLPRPHPGKLFGKGKIAELAELFRAAEVELVLIDGHVSPVQQRQMTTVIADGAHAVAVSGDFDDCQAVVKALFNDLEFRDQVNLSAINSINWARLMPQIVYYFAAALRLGAPARKVAFSVPTGNFGNVFAGYVAVQMGLPVERLIIASNQNDILPRFFASGAMARETVVPSLSPSMDIQVSSNFERLLFELLDRDGAATATVMQHFAETGQFEVDDSVLARARQLFSAYRLDDAAHWLKLLKPLRSQI